MPTSMMDALAHEQVEIAKLMAESSRLSIEALRRANLLRRQLEHLAGEERNHFITTVSNLSISRSEGYSGNQPPATNPTTPEFHPQARDGEEGNQGSGAVASGGAKALDVAEPEQAVADAASGGRSGHRADPEADPDAPYLPLDHVLDLYAENGDRDVAAIAKIAAVSEVVVATYIRVAREEGDKRAAAGDLHRLDKEPVEKKPRRKFPQPKPADVEELEPRERNPGDLLILDMKDCRASYDGEIIQLVRWEARLLLLLNAQVPVRGIEIMARCSSPSMRAVRRDLAKLNPRLTTIGVTVAELVGDHFQLQPVEPSP